MKAVATFLFNCRPTYSAPAGQTNRTAIKQKWRQLHKIMRLFIFRTPEQKGKIYTVCSEDEAYAMDVEFQQGLSLNFWNVTFRSSSAATGVEMSVDSFNFTFVSSGGKILGSVREAPFSVMGKSIVEDERGQIIGFVRASVLQKMTLLSREEKKIGRCPGIKTRSCRFWCCPAKYI